MEYPELLGYAAMILLGTVLGLIGAGGSILTVPVLVYCLSIPATRATGYSLLIVGVSALAGAIQYLRRRQSSPRMALVFGLPAILGVYLSRRVIFPAVPDPVFHVGGTAMSKDVVVMSVFAAFMVVVAISMIRNGRERVGAAAAVKSNRNPIISFIGLVVGIFTGFVGAGGGFMILPVLVLLGGLPMKVAIGTSLLIIASKSLIGFIGEAQVAESIDYGFIAAIIALPLIGIVIGTYLNNRVPAGALRTAFGWFVLVMGAAIVVKELIIA